MRDQPEKPIDRAMWWTEHVLRHGGARHLRSPASNKSWAQYFMLDLVFSIFLIAFGLFIACYVVLKTCLRISFISKIGKQKLN